MKIHNMVVWNKPQQLIALPSLEVISVACPPKVKQKASLYGTNPSASLAGLTGEFFWVSFKYTPMALRAMEYFSSVHLVQFDWQKQWITKSCIWACWDLLSNQYHGNSWLSLRDLFIAIRLSCAWQEWSEHDSSWEWFTLDPEWQENGETHYLSTGNQFAL